MKFVNTLRTLIAICAIAVTAQASAGPILLVNNGILTGATGVNVGGTMYDVRFAVGSCNSLFNGCVNSAFTFNLADSLVAAQALLDQVFVDGAAGQFDSDITSVFGCNSTVDCATIVPSEIEMVFDLPRVIGGTARNYSALSPRVDRVEFNGVYTYVDINRSFINFAMFELAAPSSTDVPEPSSLALLGLAAAGLSIARRRKSKVAGNSAQAVTAEASWPAPNSLRQANT